MYAWNLIYFVFFCFNSKKTLKTINTTLYSKITSKKPLFANNFITLLRDIDVIHRKVMAFSDIWSLFVLINWIGLASLMGVNSITVLLWTDRQYYD